MKLTKRLVIATLTPFTAGLLATLNYAPYNLWWINLLAISLLFWNLNKSKWLIGIISIYIFWATYFISGMFWVQNGMAIYSRVSSEKALIITIFIGLVYAFFLTVPWVAYCRTGLNSLTRLMLFPLIWIFGEWGRYWLFDGLTWLIQGYGHQSSWLAGWIPIFGSLGASFFAALTAALIIVLIQNLGKKAMLMAFSAVIFIWGAGYFLGQIQWTKDMGVSIPVTAVQPNRLVSSSGRNNVEARNKRWVAELEQASQNSWKPGLLIWPEGALKLKPKHITDYIDEISSQAETSNTAFFAGGAFYPDADNDKHLYNSLYGLGLAKGLYHKVHRAPLGEYSPLNGRLGKIIPWLNSTVPPKGFGDAYQPPLVFTFNEQEFVTAVSICYEIAFGNLIQQDAGKSNLLLNLSNDAWFNGTRELDQALQMAQIRALEHQKPMIRSTNSGLTAVIDHRGNVVKHAPREIATVFNSNIRPRKGQTPYSLGGDMPIFILALLLVFAVNLGTYYRDKKVKL